MASAYPGAPDAIPEIISAYENQIGQLEALVRDMTPAQLRERPIKGKWSTLELLCHLCDAEQVICDRLKRTISMPNALLMAFDESEYALKLAYEQRDPAVEMAMIRAMRQQMAAIFKSLPAEGWNRKAVHSERGINSVKDIAQTSVAHVMHHLPFLREKRKALGLPG